MATLAQHLRLLLIIAIVLSPVQPLFAMQADDAMAMSMNHRIAIASISNFSRSDASKMLSGHCDKQGKCSNCQTASHCSSCPLSLGISQIISKYPELNAQTRFTVSDVSFHSADPLPDYRPPRHS